MALAAATDTPPYASRLDLARYDRTPTLSNDERRTAERWIAPEGCVITDRQLPRLYAPLADALLHDGRERGNRLRTIKFLLMEVGRTGQAYWGWSDQHWIELVNNESMMTGHLLAVAYLLCGFKRFYDVQRTLHLSTTGRLVFGHEAFDAECDRLMTALERVGFRCDSMRAFMPSVIAAVALEGGDPRLESFHTALLERTRGLYTGQVRKRIGMLANGLAALGVANEPIRFRLYESRRGAEAGDVHPEWMDWCRRWLETSTLRDGSRRAVYNGIVRVGMWLAKAHPEVTGPEHWTADICADYLAAVDRLKVGEWVGTSFDDRQLPTLGKPLCPQSKIALLQHMRRFLSDVQSWEWATLRCNPRYHLATPRSVLNLVAVNPRTIDDAVWLKLVWASLNLEEADLVEKGRYPLEFLKAIAVVWTHAGLRSNEILRLRLKCAELQTDDLVDDAGNVTTPAGKLCYLAVPASKTSTAYVKPVNAVVYTYIEAWKQVRPEQRPVLDRKTGELVNYLFQLRNLRLDKQFVNNVVIPLLCAKAGVPIEDSAGRITSHRGRASAVTALASVPQGMSLYELQQWCGHRSPDSTMHYVRVRPTQLAGSFAKADRMARMIKVLIDHEAVVSGAARDGEPYRFYDLGDILCTNAFWSTCPHRFACAGCYFGWPKASARAAAVTARSSVTEMLQTVQMSPDESAAAEGDVEVLDRFLAKLDDKPALDGRTPREISRDGTRAAGFGRGRDGGRADS